MIHLRREPDSHNLQSKKGITEMIAMFNSRIEVDAELKSGWPSILKKCLDEQPNEWFDRVGKSVCIST